MLGGVGLPVARGPLWLQGQALARPPAALTRTPPAPLRPRQAPGRKASPLHGPEGACGARGAVGVSASGVPFCGLTCRSLRMSSRWPESCGFGALSAQRNRLGPPFSQMAPRGLAAALRAPPRPKAHRGGPVGRLLAPQVSLAHCYLCKKARLRETLSRSFPFPRSLPSCLPAPGPAGGLRARPPAVPSPHPRPSGLPPLRAAASPGVPPAPGPVRCHSETRSTPRPSAPGVRGRPGGEVPTLDLASYTSCVSSPLRARPPHRPTLRPPRLPLL